MEQILIIEDDPIFMEIMKLGLKEYKDKFEVITAENMDKAVEILNGKSVSLVITELLMPEMDGASLLKFIKEHHPDVPCVVMAPYGELEQKEEIKDDILYYLEKPFEAEDLARIVMTALDSNLLYDTGSFERDLNRTGGFIRGISVGSFMQMIEMEEKTCLMEVALEDEKKGLFYFKEGELYDAVVGKIVGREAALKLIPIERPKIRLIKPPKQKIKRRIDEPLMGLIMEAMRRKDEKSGTKEKKAS